MLKYTKDKVGTPVNKCPPPVVMGFIQFGCSVLCFTVFWLSALLRLEATLLG